MNIYLWILARAGQYIEMIRFDSFEIKISAGFAFTEMPPPASGVTIEL